MKVRNALGVLAVSLIFSLCGEQTAMSQIFLFKRLKEQNTALNSENFRMRTELDSLSALVDAYKNTIDSLTAVPVEDTSALRDLEITDSLVHMWYLQQSKVNSKEYDIENEHFSSNVTDEEFVRRLNDIHSAIPLSFNDIVKNYCILYSEKMPSSMGTVMGLCEYYWPIFDEIFAHYGLPLELKALVIVESMLKPTATSRVGAKGLWQFMYRTARGYGMVIDSWVDERMDPLKSTEMAARYLKDAYNMFGDWNLAIASYNCGANGVNKAIRRSGGKREFWDIYPYLPRETRGYVPAFEGALYTIHYYKEYGIRPKADLLEIPVDTFIVHKNIHYGQLRDVIGVPVETVESLNPQYLHQVVPGADRPSLLRLPMKYTNAFLEQLDSICVHDTAKYFNPIELKKISDGVVSGSGRSIVYKVKSGDYLGRIAQRYGVSVAQIRKWNGMRNDKLRIGQKLVIYPRR